MREWNSQAILEKHHQLPPTVESSDHPMKEVHSQIFFIPNFVKPLLDLTMQAVPGKCRVHPPLPFLMIFCRNAPIRIPV